MKYSQIREMDISNGEGIGVSLFVQGCSFHCKDCFNEETWDFDGGKEWTEDVKNNFVSMCDKPYVKRISILGGEPLATRNVDGVFDLINEIRSRIPDKNIWLYSGHTWDQVRYLVGSLYTNLDYLKIRRNIVEECDVFVDGQYKYLLKDPSLKWRGSSNQRVIDVQKSLQQNKVVLYCD